MQALMVIDMQNDFVDPNGKAVVAQAEATVNTIADLLAYWRAQNWPIIHVVRSHAADGSDSEMFRRQAPVCVTDTWGAKPFPSLEPQSGEKVLIKTRFSAFYRTHLVEWLAEQNINHIVITGTQLPNCVRGTAVDALYNDINVTIVTDACSAQNQTIAGANLLDLENMSAHLVHSGSLLETEVDII